MVNGARSPGVQPQPRLPFPTPMEQAYWARMQAPTQALEVVTTEPMLVPPVVHGLNLPSQDQQKWRHRTQVVYPPPPLYGHPSLHPPRVLAPPPPLQVHHHDPRVEVAGPPPLERPGQARIRPELAGEVAGEVGVAVLRRRQDPPSQIDGPEPGDVVDHHQVGVEVYHALHVLRDDLGQVHPRIVEWLVQGLADRLRDLAPDPVRVEPVDPEVEAREGGPDGGEHATVEPGPEEVELHVLGTRGVLQD
ncbi:hypothetical protein TorRG33x02_307230 [Trema orientale]|uniref:Uncharacterized protein n=1 Tax=Trema orientale TaxID=63057 RepID=A0A2P5BVS6_TREOI|nr:hypothetical protein TorRG33x02_307230 [Trema orientale]